MNKVSSINSDEIISILKEEIENFDSVSKDSEVGTVVAVGDGIATIYGIDHAMYGEIVTFDTGLKGMVQDIQKNEIGVILFGQDTDIKEGTKVTRTGKKAGVPVGNKYVGRVVNALGAPIDGKGEIEADDYRPIQQYIIHDLNRGATLYTAQGAYDETHRTELITIITQQEYRTLLNYLHSCGQKVFVTVSTVNEVIGQWNSK